VADLASAPDALAAVPQTRLPTIDVARLRRPEGDTNGAVRVELPFQVNGEVTRPARFGVTTVGQEIGDVQRFTVDLAPGQTHGSIPITYRSDTRDDYAKLITQVSTYAMRNMMTDAYVGDLTVLDDDPTPRLTVRALHRRVAEGKAVAWRITLARPVDYDLFVSGKVVRGPAPNLAAADVAASWLRDHLGEDADADKPLWTYHPYLFADIGSGRTRTTLRIPTRKDGVEEGRESLTIKLRAPHLRATRTAFVTD
jgi:hypothetical protein